MKKKLEEFRNDPEFLRLSEEHRELTDGVQLAEVPLIIGIKLNAKWVSSDTADIGYDVSISNHESKRTRYSNDLDLVSIGHKIDLEVSKVEKAHAAQIEEVNLRIQKLLVDCNIFGRTVGYEVDDEFFDEFFAC